jgi:glycosyltransferase involved in cell wall biosynthesis
LTSHRVLHFLWTGELGGAERAVYQLVREEMRRGEWDVGVAFGQARGPWAEEIGALGCKIIDMGMRSTVDLPRALGHVERLREFDIHHFHVLEPCQILASARCKQATRVFTQRHGAHLLREPLRKSARRSLGVFLLRRYMDAVAGNTRHALEYAVARYGLERLPSQVTYNGIDFSLLTPAMDRETMRRQIGAGGDAIVVGSSGSLNRCKRFERLVALLAMPQPIQVVLVGDGALRPALEAQATALGARDRFLITGKTREVPDYLQTMDVFLLPSSAEESFGNSVIEAMAIGVPSIVFADSPGLCEHIESGVTGFIANDEPSLRTIVQSLSVDATLRRRVGAAGAEYVRRTYDLEKMHQSYRAFYELALAHRRANDTTRQTTWAA